MSIGKFQNIIFIRSDTHNFELCFCVLRTHFMLPLTSTHRFANWHTFRLDWFQSVILHPMNSKPKESYVIQAYKTKGCTDRIAYWSFRHSFSNWFNSAHCYIIIIGGGNGVPTSETVLLSFANSHVAFIHSTNCSTSPSSISLKRWAFPRIINLVVEIITIINGYYRQQLL